MAAGTGVTAALVTTGLLALWFASHEFDAPAAAAAAPDGDDDASNGGGSEGFETRTTSDGAASTMTSMPENLTREDVQRLVAEDAQIVEVLPREEYDEIHIAGAISIPLQELGERAPAELDRGRAVIAYCHDFL